MEGRGLMAVDRAVARALLETSDIFDTNRLGVWNPKQFMLLSPYSTIPCYVLYVRDQSDLDQ